VSRLDWSRPLPRPLTIPEVMKLATLDDVRVLMQKHLPAGYRAKFAWRQLAAMLRRTAQGKTDCAELATALQWYSSSKASRVIKAAPLPAAVGYRRARPQ
jgi:hypothetical protein